MRFDRWRYSPETNRFTNEPVIAVTPNIDDDIWVRMLQTAVMFNLVRRIEARWSEAFEQFQKKAGEG